jgi:hypothetical protein
MSVYFAQAGRYVKIGYSTNPLGRSTTITTSGTRPDGLPRKADAELIGWIPGNERREGVLHARFVDQRVAGEWFLLNADQVSEIRELIWSDPGGIDMQRMSAMAVLTAAENPEATRDDIAAAGIQIEATSLHEALKRILGGAA